MEGSSYQPAESDSLQPLPSALRLGLPFVACFGLLSLVSCTLLFLYLTSRLFRWYKAGQIRHCNQFWILLYNLLIADIQQAVAFALTTVWVSKNKIEVGSRTCFANGWFVSTGDLASSIFIFTIALHTFFSVVKGRSINHRVFYAWIAFAWVFVYTLASITVMSKPDVYVRAGAWCWIDAKYANERLWLHYFWIFVSMFGTIVIYSLIFLSMYSRLSDPDPENRAHAQSIKRATKYMIIYPTTYVICTLPLAGGRMAAMTGSQVPNWYLCLAGASITSCGWIDVLLYAFSRQALVFGDEPVSRTVHGFQTFGWHNASSQYESRTVIEGPLTNKKNFPRPFSECRVGLAHLRPTKSRDSAEDYFASPTEGNIMTKTTVEVYYGPTMDDSASAVSLRAAGDIKSCASPTASRSCSQSSLK